TDDMHMATRGQSWQSLFCSSGQHGKPTDASEMSIAHVTQNDFAAAGTAKGPATSPAITKIAKNRPMCLRKSIWDH
ncbi:hypothetical protein ACPXBC_31435, partial [Escherichia coli]|uniref:hypothetical protein n=1 Tax=Escherichia coli TaxID=562 RepID=UPI003CE4A309